MSEANAMLGGDSTPPPSPPVPPPSGEPPAPPPPAATWTDGLDDDAKKYVETKGFKSPAEALAELRQFSPPESPDAYEIPIPQGEDPTFAKSVAPLFHKAGLSPAQAKALAEGWNEMQATQRQAMQEAEAATARETEALQARQKADLQREWGNEFDANSEHVRRAWRAGAEATGLSQEQLEEAVDVLGGKIGFPSALKLFAFYGRHFSEDKPHGMGGGAGPSLSTVASSLYDKSGMNP